MTVLPSDQPEAGKDWIALMEKRQMSLITKDEQILRDIPDMLRRRMSVLPPSDTLDAAAKELLDKISKRRQTILPHEQLNAAKELLADIAKRRMTLMPKDLIKISNELLADIAKRKMSVLPQDLQIASN